MTYAPATLTDLMAYWTRQGGVNLGISGDLAHQKRASYHNGQDAITKYGRTAATDYSIRLSRDREPYLTNAAAGCDLGKLDGTLANLQKISSWLVQRCIDRAPGTEDIREVIYSPDGKVVKRWDNHDRVLRDGYPTTTGQGDQTHLWHTHISWYRDSEKRQKVAVFAPYFEEEESVIHYRPNGGSRPGKITLKEGRKLISLITGKLYTPPTLEEDAYCRITIKPNPDGSWPEYFSAETGRHSGFFVGASGEAMVALDDVVVPGSFVPKVFDDPAPEPAPEPTVLEPGVYKVT
jgi:hypothetical protein